MKTWEQRAAAVFTWAPGMQDEFGRVAALVDFETGDGFEIYAVNADNGSVDKWRAASDMGAFDFGHRGTLAELLAQVEEEYGESDLLVLPCEWSPSGTTTAYCIGWVRGDNVFYMDCGQGRTKGQALVLAMEWLKGGKRE